MIEKEVKDQSYGTERNFELFHWNRSPLSFSSFEFILLSINFEIFMSSYFSIWKNRYNFF